MRQEGERGEEADGQEEERRGYGGGRWSAGMDRGGEVEEVGTGRPLEWTGQGYLCPFTTSFNVL